MKRTDKGLIRRVAAGLRLLGLGHSGRLFREAEVLMRELQELRELRELLWLIGAATCLAIARAIDLAPRNPDSWRRIAGLSISGICWMLFVVCVVKWMGK